MIPKVKFETNLELDIQMTHSFLAWGKSDGGMDFSDSIFGPNPALRELDMDDEIAVQRFFEKTYQERASDFQKVIDWNQKHWGKVEEDFVKKVTSLFKGHEFPEGNYIAYLSINNCNPRFVEDKTFQMYYKANVYNRTIAHELTHFIFYDYTANMLKDTFGGLDPNQGAYWSLAELFNNVILSLPEYVELLDNYEDSPYPNHTEHYNPLKSIWEKSNDVDELILSGFEYLRERI